MRECVDLSPRCRPESPPEGTQNAEVVECCKSLLEMGLRRRKDAGVSVRLQFDQSGTQAA